MVQVSQDKTYLSQVKKLSDSNLQRDMKALLKAGYKNFDENKVMIESNPAMTIEDIMACIDEANQGQGLDLENIQTNSSDEEAMDLAAEEWTTVQPRKKQAAKVDQKAGKSVKKQGTESQVLK